MQTSLWSVGIDEQGGQTDCNLRFQGQWFDEESGLHYNFHRYYDPQTGRYISNDPIGLEGGFNTYGYVKNPLAWVDPFGLAGCKAESLPTLKGKRIPQIQKTLQDDGFVLRNPANPRNQRWVHPDGSEVQIHKYGNTNTTPHRSGNNAHIHKSIGRHGDSSAIELNDRGFPSTNPNETHIGVRNPADYPTVAGRPHGR